MFSGYWVTLRTNISVETRMTGLIDCEITLLAIYSGKLSKMATSHPSKYDNPSVKNYF